MFLTLDLGLLSPGLRRVSTLGPWLGVQHGLKCAALRVCSSLLIGAAVPRLLRSMQAASAEMRFLELPPPCYQNARAMHIQVTFVEADGRESKLPLPTGRTLMRGAVSSGVESVAADCGGSLTCATCHVYIGEPWAALLPAVTPGEADMLEMTASPREPTSRLSCQIPLTAALDGLRVRLPPTQY